MIMLRWYYIPTVKESVATELPKYRGEFKVKKFRAVI